MDCHSESPLAISYPDLPLVAGNRVECSCVFEARNNDSGKAECLVSCMDQSIYYVAEDSVSEIALAVAVRSAFQLGTNPGPDRSLRFRTRDGWTSSIDTSRNMSRLTHSLTLRSWARTPTAVFPRGDLRGVATIAWFCTGGPWDCC